LIHQFDDLLRDVLGPPCPSQIDVSRLYAAALERLAQLNAEALVLAPARRRARLGGLAG
jgi:hypothetical protein